MSDWSSDVCSSDLQNEGDRDRQQDRIGPGETRRRQTGEGAGLISRLVLALLVGLVAQSRNFDGDCLGTHAGAELNQDRAVRHGGHAACRSDEHTSELQSLMRISYAVFCLNKKKQAHNTTN